MIILSFKKNSLDLQMLYIKFYVYLPLVVSFRTLICWLTLSWRKPLSYRKQSIDLRFLYDNGLRLERVKLKIQGFGFEFTHIRISN